MLGRAEISSTVLGLEVTSELLIRFGVIKNKAECAVSVDLDVEGVFCHAQRTIGLQVTE